MRRCTLFVCPLLILVATVGATGAEPKPSAPPKKELNHWGKELVGFDWFESDSVDGRWQQAQVGTFLASIVPIEGQPTEKGLSIKVGPSAEGTVCYDTARGQMRAAWLEGFLKFHPARYGLIEAPAPAGKPVFMSTKHAGFGVPGSNEEKQIEFHYRGLWRNGARTVLEWTVGNTPVRETPWLETVGELRLVTREFEIGAASDSLMINLIERPAAWERVSNGDTQIAVARDGEEAVAFAVVANPKMAELRLRDSRAVELVVAPRKAAVNVRIFTWRGPAGALGEFAKALKAAPASQAVEKLAAAGPAQWTESIVTRGVRGKDDAPYVIDTITIPFENPYKALFFTAGHDFLTADAAMVCTVHGDVWLVTGLSGDLSELRWKRFATGLFQPLGMVIRPRYSAPPRHLPKLRPSNTDGYDVLVLCRDHIARLHDVNGDDEADYYEVFHETIATSAGGHDYVTCLETDSTGRLYYLNALEGLVRLSPDGKKKEIVATGFRNPNGLGVSREGVMTVAPQEGEWTPASGIFQVVEGSYGGYGGPKVKAGRPLGYDPPVCWLPRRQDNSSGGQVWVNSNRWGPLGGRLLHTSFGQCTLQLVLTEVVDGITQGGTVVLPPVFESGICRGRFSPFDGQLYLTGLRGWTTAATQDGCLQRLRYTGQPVHLPVRVATLANGLMLTFSGSLQRDSAEDPDNYFAEQWNVTYRQEYGSPEFKVSNPREEGRDPVEILSATLLEDGRTVFLETPPLQPVSQLVLSYSLEAEDGAKLAQKYAHTIHRMPDVSFEAEKMTRRARKGQLAQEVQDRLRPGVKWTFPEDVRVTRLVALAEEPGRVGGGAFAADAEGFLFVPLKGDYRFRIESSAPADLAINDQIVKTTAAGAAPASDAVTLHKGYNRYKIACTSSGAPLSLRLFWSSDAFAEEPVPPESLFTILSEDEEHRLDVRRGADLVLNHHCRRCHSGLESRLTGLFERGAPSLEGAGARFTRDWLAAWIADPQAQRPGATMPAVLGHLDEKTRGQAAADLVAYLATLSGEKEPGLPEPSEEAVAQGAKLYENFGCAACHRVTPSTDEDEWSRISLAHTRAKFQPGKLAQFLQTPHKHFASSWMPDFRLTDVEASELSAYLQAQGTASIPAAAAGDAARGQLLYRTSGCGNCHQTAADEKVQPATAAALKSVSKAAVGRGCLAAAPRAEKVPGAAASPAPAFNFQEGDRTAIAAFLTSPPVVMQHPAHETARLMASLRCTACHDRDGRRGPRMEILAEEGSGMAPEPFPALTWTGDRLKVDWMERFLAGASDEKPREWLSARMPKFPAYAPLLAAGLAAEHGHIGSVHSSAAQNAALVEAGRELVQSSGLDCRQCHAIGKQPPTGDKKTLLAPGINFAMVKHRMRPEFYGRWMLDPTRFDPNTRMPKLAIDGKTTKITGILEGDARKQFDAIWVFLQNVEDDEQRAAGAAGNARSKLTRLNGEE